MHDRERFPLTLRRLFVLTAATMFVAAFLCPQPAIAQVTLSGVRVAPDITQPVAGDCATFNSFLSTSGVSVGGQAHPGRCRDSVFTPVFDRTPLGSNMTAFLNSHPRLFTVHTSSQGLRHCATLSTMTVTVSGSIQATRLTWAGAPVVGAKCTNEVTRVNASLSRSSTQAMMTRVLKTAGSELMAPPLPTGCGTTPQAALNALNEQVWSRFQLVASHELQNFQTNVVPVMDASSSCAAKCNLCFPGWVGQIVCTAKVNDPSYHWDETQTWDVGGTTTTVAGKTEFPAVFTATGTGNKQGGPSWTINATTMGQFEDAGVNANKRFSTSNATASNGITWSTGMSGSEGEMQVEFNANQNMPTIATSGTLTSDSMPSLPACINTPQRPTTIVCNPQCTWDLLQQ